MTDPTPARLRESPLTLMKQAAGTPAEMAAKLRRLASTLAGYAKPAALDERLQRLQRIGYVDEPPSRLQLVIGSNDMLRFWIVPAAEDYYREKGISFAMHQVLRILDEPASMVDPTGFLSTVDNIVGHLMQVVHANPEYDLQLLESHEGGLEALEAQLVQMLEGTHPRARSIGAIVEEPEYHGRLLDYVRAYRRGERGTPPLRSNIEGERFAALERTFGTLPAAMRYFSRLPNTPLGGARHWLLVKEFPMQLAEPA